MQKLVNSGKIKTQVLAKILAHEITHRMQETSPENYARYRDLVIQDVAAVGGGNLDEQIRKYQADYRKEGQELSREEAMDEIAADYTQMFIEKTEMFREFIGKSKEHRQFGKWLIETWHAIVDKIRGASTSRQSQNTAAQEATGYDLATIEKALKLWEEAYAEGQKAVKNAPVRESTGDGKKKNSIEFIPINKESENNAKLRGDAVLTTDKEILEVINLALTNRQSKGNYILGSIPDTVKQRIEADLGLSIFKKGEYVFKFSTDDVRHIEEHFSTPPEILKAIHRLYDVVCNYDTVDTEVGKEGTRKLVFKKHYADYDFLSVEIASKRTRSLDLVTFYVTKNNKKAEGKIQSPAKQQGLATQGVSPSNKIITQPDAKVKHSVAGTSDILLENAELARSKRATQDRLNYLRKQVAVTKEKTADPKSVDKIAGKLVRQWGADMESLDISQDLQVLYDHILRKQDVDLWEEATAIGRKIAENITQVDGDIFAEYRDMRRELRDMHIYVSPEIVADIPDYEDKVSVPSDQLRRLLEVVDTIYEHGASRFLESSEIEDAAAWIANDILDSSFQLDSFKSLADIKAENRQAVKDATLAGRMAQGRIDQKRIQKVREQLDAVKVAKEQQIEELKQANREKNKATIERIQEITDVKKYRRRVEKKVKKLTDAMLKNSDKEHIPEALKQVVGQFLDSIDSLSFTTQKNRPFRRLFCVVEPRGINEIKVATSF